MFETVILNIIPELLQDEFETLLNFGPMSILWTQKVEHFLSA